MQQFDVLCLLLSYVALGTLCLLVLLRQQASWRLKASVIAGFSGLYIATFFWIQGLLGWSAAIALPTRFKLIAGRVVEPDLVRERAGGIHLWVEELDDRNLPSGVPRAFLLPYSTALARKISDANEEIKAGRAQAGLVAGFADGLAPVSESAGEAPVGANVRTVTQGATAGGDPSGGGVLDPAALGGQSNAVNLIPLPPPRLPLKDQL